MSSDEKKNIIEKDEEISFKDLLLRIQLYWKFLLSKWLLILIFGCIGAVCGIAYAYLKKPVYSAVTTFVLEDEKHSSGLGSLAGLASIAGVDLSNDGGNIFQGDNIFELYKSRVMIEKTLLSSVGNNSKETLFEKYIKFNNLRKKWAKAKFETLSFTADSITSGGESLKRNRLRDSIVTKIVDEINKSNLMVGRPDKKLSIVKVEVKSLDEAFSKSFNEALVKNVNDYYIKTKTKKSQQNVDILQHKTDSVRSIMYGAINTAASVSDATPNLNLTRLKQRIAPMQKAQFNAEANKGVLNELLKNLELSKMTVLKETPLLQVIDQPIFPLPQERVGYIKGAVIGGGFFGLLAAIWFLAGAFLRVILEKK